ncbi:hypothetical protein QBC39DRAFT_330321 [Podospora conica]|nr:hypothetical protein QBC39DRAFT_330321 [Schizothecium conicum]
MTDHPIPSIEMASDPDSPRYPLDPALFHPDPEGQQPRLPTLQPTFEPRLPTFALTREPREDFQPAWVSDDWEEKRVSPAKWILFVFPRGTVLEEAQALLEPHFRAPLRGLGYVTVYIHAADICNFMGSGPFTNLKEKWKTLLAVILVNPDFLPPPGPLAPPRPVTMLAEFVHAGGLVILAGPVANGFAHNPCHTRFFQDIRLTTATWEKSASIVACAGLDSSREGKSSVIPKTTAAPCRPWSSPSH